MNNCSDDAMAAELERLELSLMDPEVRRDRNRVAALLDADFLEFGSSGQVWTREATLDLLSSETYTPPEVENFSCSWLAANVVLCTYRTLRRGEEGGRITTLRSSIWTSDSGAWKMRFHQGTRGSNLSKG
jgi:hypothetical protein